jgi:hypothetical protein
LERNDLNPVFVMFVTIFGICLGMSEKNSF